MTEIIPAIIPKSLKHLRSELSKVKGVAERVQIDAIDGVFAPEASFPYDSKKSREEFEELANEEVGFPYWEDFNFEADLMVKNPEQYVDGWIDAGVTAIIIHVDSTTEHESIIEKAKGKNVEVGMALKPKIPNEDLFSWIEKIDFVQFMGNDEIGYHGRELDDVVYQKIMDLKEVNPEITAAVDIGVNEETAPLLIDAGADKLISGSFIFDSEDIEEAIMALKSHDG